MLIINVLSSQLLKWIMVIQYKCHFYTFIVGTFDANYHEPMPILTTENGPPLYLHLIALGLKIKYCTGEPGAVPCGGAEV